MNHHPHAHPALSRIDSCSSIASDATAPNLPGAGRLLGLLLYASGERLEVFLNKRSSRRRSRQETAAKKHPTKHFESLSRADTHTSVASDATAPNLPGAGRTLGLFLFALGARIEARMNRHAARLQLGPEAVAQKIRIHRRHDELSVPERYTSSAGFASERDRRVLQKLCKKLVNYSSAHVLSTQLLALNEIVQLSTEDPIIRIMLKRCNLTKLVPRFTEPDLITSTSKALGSLEDTKIHGIWSLVLSSNGRSLDNVDSEDFRTLKNTLRDSGASYIAARYLFHILHAAFTHPDTKFHTFSSEMWIKYLITALYYPQMIEWENMNKCLQFCVPDPLIRKPVVHRLERGDYKKHEPSYSKLFLEYIKRKGKRKGQLGSVST
ncbi:hypothetical protein SCHPADRAFT_946646 [Schizopora paradoxa]|uniref:Uncharacterized protein n=1 Tax=Schizopora paradoxa TaxID=27342 RepID=A0A0H2RLN9_9AGAM|nr:hypothetical protein SCHPADRAFT_946646 [Schizopora paradoxa]